MHDLTHQEGEESKLKVNFCGLEELRCIPGVGAQLAETIVMLRKSHGNMDAELLCKLMRRPLSPSALQRLECSPNPEYDGFINEYGSFGESYGTPASQISQCHMAGGADTSAMRSSSISRLMSRSNLTGDPERHVSIQPDSMSLRIDKEINNMKNL